MGSRTADQDGNGKHEGVPRAFAYLSVVSAALVGGSIGLIFGPRGAFIGLVVGGVAGRRWFKRLLNDTPPGRPVESGSN